MKIEAYQAKDGTIFESAKECEEYDNKRICYRCKGKGKFTKYDSITTFTKDDLREPEPITTICDTCKGKGYLLPRDYDLKVSTDENGKKF